jgi:hypothetical protein
MSKKKEPEDIQLDVQDERQTNDKVKVSKWVYIRISWHKLLQSAQTDAMKKTYRAIVAFGISILFTLVILIDQRF